MLAGLNITACLSRVVRVSTISDSSKDYELQILQTRTYDVAASQQDRIQKYDLQSPSNWADNDG